MIQPQDTEMMNHAISFLLDKICNKYITDSSVLPLILSNDNKQMQSLQLIDFLHQSVLTSLQFGQYRRAVWYLQAFYLACDKTFVGRNKEIVIQELQNRIRI